MNRGFFLFLISSLIMVTLVLGYEADSFDDGEALIVLGREVNATIKEAIRYIHGLGGRVVHIFSDSILVGEVPRRLGGDLLSKGKIEAVYYSEVDRGAFEGYGEEALLAVDAWNLRRKADAREITSSVSGEEHGIEGDLLIHQDSSIGQESLNHPYGAGVWDTSEYMMGDVSISIIFPESNGGVDLDLEDWTSLEEAKVVSEVQGALDWWAEREPRAHLTFNYTMLTNRSTGYEPITRPVSNESLWINEVMTGLGYTAGDRWQRVKAYLNDLREKDGTDWAFVVFVIDSSNDVDGTFSDGLFAYCYLGGPYFVMTYDNDGYGIENMDAVAAHETGHVFYALDQYYGAGHGCNMTSGYLNVENQNSQYGQCLSDVPSVMRGGVSPFANGQVDPYARGQVGWRDSDGDDVLDIIDFEPDTYLRFDSRGMDNATYSGTAWTNETLPNSNPYGFGNDITINTITMVQYRVTLGRMVRGWMDAAPLDDFFDEVAEDYAFTLTDLSPGKYIVEVRSLNRAGNWESQPYSNHSLTLHGGFLKIETNPPVPATLYLDGVPVDPWGLDYLPLTPGTHNVSFGDVAYYVTPPEVAVAIVENETTMVIGDYTRAGFLKIETNPPVPATLYVNGLARAVWGLDYLPLSPGNYTVRFGDVTNYVTPQDQTVIVVEDQTSVVVGEYVRAGLLKVETNPPLPGVIHVDDVAKAVWGLDYLPIEPGNYTVSFGDVDGYVTPEDVVVEVLVDQTSIVVGNYVEDLDADYPDSMYGLLKIETDPPVPATLYVDGVAMDPWGLDYLPLPSGNYTVRFGDVSSYVTPPDQEVSINDNITVCVTGMYVAAGLLKIETDPPVPATLYVDDVPVDPWGLDYLPVKPGSYRIRFGDVSNYVTPLDDFVEVEVDQTSVIVGEYMRAGLLKVETDPPLPGVIYVDNVAKAVWGLDYLPIEPGNHTVSFGDVEGYFLPENQVVSVVIDEVTIVVGDYLESG